MNCPCCAAPLAAGGVVCSYCGHRMDVDLQGWAQLQAAEPRGALHCADCHSALEALQLPGPGAAIPVGRCPQCLGLFLPLGGLEQLLQQSGPPIAGIDRRLLQNLIESPRSSPAPVRYRPCPHCSELMHRRLQGIRSGVVVDRCRDHGIWLDAGELRTLLEWVQAGGRLLEDQRQEEQRLAVGEDLSGLLLRLAQRLS